VATFVRTSCQFINLDAIEAVNVEPDGVLMAFFGGGPDDFIRFSGSDAKILQDAMDVLTIRNVSDTSDARGAFLANLEKVMHYARPLRGAVSRG
jgi:hypothetical protein